MPSKVHLAVVFDKKFSSSEIHNQCQITYVRRYCVDCYHLSAFSLHLKLKITFTVVMYVACQIKPLKTEVAGP